MNTTNISMRGDMSLTIRGEVSLKPDNSNDFNSKLNGKHE